MSEITTVGLDLAKNVFQVHGADGSGRAMLRKRLRRDQVLAFFSQSAVQEGARLGRMAWFGASRAFDRRKADTAGHQQTRQSLYSSGEGRLTVWAEVG